MGSDEYAAMFKKRVAKWRRKQLVWDFWGK
jgi:hypothetical protein